MVVRVMGWSSMSTTRHENRIEKFLPDRDRIFCFKYADACVFWKEPIVTTLVYLYSHLCAPLFYVWRRGKYDTVQSPAAGSSWNHAAPACLLGYNGLLVAR